MISKKTRSLIQFIIGALFVVFGTIVLVLFARGFSYDFLTGQVKITGLVVIDSSPNGAKIRINSNDIKQKTPYRLTYVEPGEMTIELDKDKYRSWSKTLFVVPEEVSFVDYAWFLPLQLKITHHRAEASITSATQAKNNSKIVYSTNGSNATLNIFEQKQSVKIYQSTNNDQSQKINSFSNLILSDSGNYLLFKQNGTSSSNYMYVATSKDQKPVNLNEMFKFDFLDNSLSFNPDNDKELFWLDKGVLRKINIDSQTISAPLIDKTISMAIFDKKIFAIRDNESKRELSYTDLNGQKSVTIMSDLITSSFYKIDFASFSGANNLTVLTDDGKLYLLSNIYDTNNLKKSLFSDNATYSSFNKNGRYLLINNKKNLKVYDFERKTRLFNKNNFKELKDLKWLDNNHMVVVDGNSVRMVDFDGQNNQQLFESNDMMPLVLLNMAEKSVYSLQPGGNDAKGQFNEIFLTLKN